VDLLISFVNLQGLSTILHRANLEMTDENTLGIQCHGSTQQDAEAREEASHIDCVFISIAFLGSQAQPCFQILPRVLSLTRSYR
jgi:hypothetical protein